MNLILNLRIRWIPQVKGKYDIDKEGFCLGHSSLFISKTNAFLLINLVVPCCFFRSFRARERNLEDAGFEMGVWCLILLSNLILFVLNFGTECSIA